MATEFQSNGIQVEVPSRLPGEPSFASDEHCQRQQGQASRRGFWNDDQVQRAADAKFTGVFGQRQVALQLGEVHSHRENVAQVNLWAGTLVQRVGLAYLERRRVGVGCRHR